MLPLGNDKSAHIVFLKPEVAVKITGGTSAYSNISTSKSVTRTEGLDTPQQAIHPAGGTRRRTQKLYVRRG
jgi:hypothetical protein